MSFSNVCNNIICRYFNSNPKIETVFSKCEKHYSLDRNNPQELKNLIYILAHCYFELHRKGKGESGITAGEEELDFLLFPAP